MDLFISLICDGIDKVRWVDIPIDFIPGSSINKIFMKHTIWKRQYIHLVQISSLVNKCIPLFGQESQLVTASIALGVAASNTYIREPASAKINLIVLSYGMDVVSDTEWDWTLAGAAATVKVISPNTHLESSTSSDLVYVLVAADFRVLCFQFFSHQSLFLLVSSVLVDQSILFYMHAPQKNLDNFPR